MFISWCVWCSPISIWVHPATKRSHSWLSTVALSLHSLRQARALRIIIANVRQETRTTCTILIRSMLSLHVGDTNRYQQWIHYNSSMSVPQTHPREPGKDSWLAKAKMSAVGGAGDRWRLKDKLTSKVANRYKTSLPGSLPTEQAFVTWWKSSATDFLRQIIRSIGILILNNASSTTQVTHQRIQRHVT